MMVEAMGVLESWSKTFHQPVQMLPPELRSAVVSEYLCLRAIDEIEDHETLDPKDKVKLLREISVQLQTGIGGGARDPFALCFHEYRELLPSVTLRLLDWCLLAPSSISPRIWDCTSAMADRMATWVERDWTIETEADLRAYCFAVSGTAGLLLSDLWAWHDGTNTSRSDAVGFGEFLQCVNIFRGRENDLKRGVDFFPRGWAKAEMYQYACRSRVFAVSYLEDLNGAVRDACTALVESSTFALERTFAGVFVEADGLGKP